MAHRHVVPVNCAGFLVPAFVRCQVRNDLVAIEVEVHPFRRTAAFSTPEQFAIELARCGKVVDGEGEMERRHGGLWGRVCCAHRGLRGECLEEKEERREKNGSPYFRMFGIF